MRATWFNQPWLADKLTPAPRCSSSAPRDKRGFGSASTRSSLRGRRGGSDGVLPAHGHSTDRRPGLRPGPSGDRAPAPQRIREWAWQACSWAPNAIEGLPAELRARRGLRRGRPTRSARRISPSPRRTSPRRGSGSRFEELFLHQALLATRKRTHRTARPAPRFGKPGELVGRWIDSLPFEPTERPAPRLRRDRVRPRLRRADAAAADGRGRLGEDRGRRLRDAAGARSRLPGGADGADRDAGRAARAHPRPPARRGGDPVRPADRRDAGRVAEASPEPARQRRAGAGPGHPRADRADGRASPASASAWSTSSTASGSSSAARSTPRESRGWRRTSCT